jgi:hypothetical protein
MPRFLRIALAAGAVLLALAALGAWASRASTGPATIRITAQQISYARVDEGRPGRSAGDVEITRELVFNKRIRATPIGRSEIVCTFVGGGLSRMCSGSVFLPKGRIVVGGPIQYRDLYELAVIGGTGLYDNARGTVTVTRTAKSPSRDFLYLRLTG